MATTTAEEGESWDEEDEPSEQTGDIEEELERLRRENGQLRRQNADLGEAAKARRAQFRQEIADLKARVDERSAAAEVWEKWRADHWDDNLNMTKETAAAITEAETANARVAQLDADAIRQQSRKVAQFFLTVVALLTALFCLYPPWLQEFRCSNAPSLRFQSSQYYWLFSTPGVPLWASGSQSDLVRQAPCWSSTIDASRLLAEVGALWAFSAVVFGLIQIMTAPTRRVARWLASPKDWKSAIGAFLGFLGVTDGSESQDKTRKVWASWLLLGSSALDLGRVIFANAPSLLPSVIGQAVWNVVIAIGLRRGGNGWRAFACFRAVMGLLLSFGLEGDYRYYSAIWCIGFLILLWGNNPTQTKRWVGAVLIAAAEKLLTSR